MRTARPICLLVALAGLALAPTRLIGGKGRDRLLGGPGRDILRGGPGKDRQRQ